MTYAAARIVQRGTNRPSGKMRGRMKNPLTAVIVRTSTIAWSTGRPGYTSSMLGGYVAAPSAIVTIAM
jgi:hypothetical protein